MEIRPIFSALMRNKTGAILVALQIAISLAILANVLHIVTQRQVVSQRSSGIAREADTFHVLVRAIAQQSSEEELATQKRNTAVLLAIPGVLAVAQVNQIPMSRSGSGSSVRAAPTAEASTDAAVYLVPDSLVRTWELKLVQGRDFLPQDIIEIDQSVSQEFPKTVIISQALAKKLWPDSPSVLGKQLYYGYGAGARSSSIVGVVERLQTPWAQTNERADFSTISPVRLTGGGVVPRYTLRVEPGQLDRVMRDVEQALRTSWRNQVILELKKVSLDRSERYRADLALAWMLVAVAVLLLLITASGIVGMASLWVAQRRKQIGVRRALGARRADILRYFVTENLLITSTGIVSGVLLAIGLNQLLVSKLEMSKLPSGYLLAGAGIFYALGVAAVYGPAWRAASISPATATRTT